MRRVAVVGATGAVGQDLRRLLEDRDFPCDEVTFVASPRSAGRVLPFRGTEATVRSIDDADVFNGVDVALFSAGGGTSTTHAPRAVEAGGIVVDNSSAWRMDSDVPLIVTEVNPHTLDRRPPKGIVANPNCTTMVAMLPLKALHDAFGLTAMVATSYQAAGGAGQKGIDELVAQVPVLFEQAELLRTNGAAARKLVHHAVHSDVLAFNVVPLLGVEQDNGYTDEELKLCNESRKILELPHLAVSPTCVRVPVMVGHAVAVRASFARPVSVEAAHTALEGFPNLLVEHAPSPLEWAGRHEVAVGRIRADLTDPYALNFWVTGDNLLKGAALNTLQIAELLVDRGLV
ncbi:MAG: aspartate-semialdehyde dehydrogenase [Egibacteraceae bacterium]